MNKLYYLLVFAAATIISFLLTLLVRKIATRFHAIDQPRGRHKHKQPTPLWGGIAIYASILIVLLFFLIFYSHLVQFSGFVWLGFIDKRLLSVLVGALILLVIGAIDDKKPLPAWYKLFWQIIAACVVLSSGIGIEYLRNPFGLGINLDSLTISIDFWNTPHNISVWGDLLAIIWIVGMINVMNFLDGLDGLAAGVSIIAFITLFVLSLRSDVNQINTAIFAVICAGSAFGFLFQNWSPAKIFMGDSGSMTLGFLLAVTAIVSGGKVATAFLVLGFPILDGLWVAGRRIAAGHSPFLADRSHLHHRLLDVGFSERTTVIFIYILTALFGVVALLSSTEEKFYALIWLCTLMTGLAISLALIGKRK